MLGYGILQPFAKQSTAWGTGIISCEFWYLLVILLLLILDGILLCIPQSGIRTEKEEISYQMNKSLLGGTTVTVGLNCLCVLAKARLI